MTCKYVSNVRTLQTCGSEFNVPKWFLILPQNMAQFKPSSILEYSTTAPLSMLEKLTLVARHVRLQAVLSRFA